MRVPRFMPWWMCRETTPARRVGTARLLLSDHPRATLQPENPHGSKPRFAQAQQLLHYRGDRARDGIVSKCDAHDGVLRWQGNISGQSSSVSGTRTHDPLRPLQIDTVGHPTVHTDCLLVLDQPWNEQARSISLCRREAQCVSLISGSKYHPCEHIYLPGRHLVQLPQSTAMLDPLLGKHSHLSPLRQKCNSPLQ